MIVGPRKAKLFGFFFGFPEYGTKTRLDWVYKLLGYPRRIQRNFGSGYLHGYMDVHHGGRVGKLGVWYYSMYHGFFKLLYRVYTPSFKTRLRLFGVCDTEISGVDSRDYPDFCDAFYESATWLDTLEPLTDEELEKLGNPGFDEAFETLL